MDITLIFICVIIAAVSMSAGAVGAYHIFVVPMAREGTAWRNELAFFPKSFDEYHKATINALNARDIDTGLTATLKTFIFEAERLKDALVAEQEAHAATHTNYQHTLADLGAELDTIKRTNDTLKNDSLALQEKLESIQFDIDLLEQDAAAKASIDLKPKVAATVKPDTSEFREAAESLLIALGNPTTNYEIGIYNGIVATANTVINAEDFKLLSPILEATKATVIMPKRDEKGRFLKAAV